MVARAERLRQFDAALDAAPRSEGDELVRWALAECDGLRGQPMKRVGINAQEGREGLYLLLPERVLGSDATVLLQIGQPPSAMISPHRWASLVLPQIAARIWEDARNPMEADEMADKAFAWKIEDYYRIGLP